MEIALRLYNVSASKFSPIMLNETHYSQIIGHGDETICDEFRKYLFEHHKKTFDTQYKDLYGREIDSLTMFAECLMTDLFSNPERVRQVLNGEVCKFGMKSPTDLGLEEPRKIPEAPDLTHAGAGMDRELFDAKKLTAIIDYSKRHPGEIISNDLLFGSGNFTIICNDEGKFRISFVTPLGEDGTIGGLSAERVSIMLHNNGVDKEFSDALDSTVTKRRFEDLYDYAKNHKKPLGEPLENNGTYISFIAADNAADNDTLIIGHKEYFAQYIDCLASKQKASQESPVRAICDMLEPVMAREKSAAEKPGVNPTNTVIAASSRSH